MSLIVVFPIGLVPVYTTLSAREPQRRGESGGIWGNLTLTTVTPHSSPLSMGDRELMYVYKIYTV